jgi:ABC-type Fe3+/spermidine/putrescine transport system ATPase subunit
VDRLTAEVAQGELTSFLGPSGCGKTTLLRIIAGFAAPDEGAVYLDGRDVTRVPPNLRDTAMVFQNYALFPHMTVFENVGYGLAVRRRPAAEIRERVAEVLRLVRLEGLEQRRPHQLSGGQQQRVALARALALRPKVLLLDEPLSNLDANLRIAMRSEIRRLRDALNLTMVFVTHDQQEAMCISDRMAVMLDGRLVQVGTPHEIYLRPADRFVARFVGQVNLLPVEMVSSADGQVRVRLAGAGGVAADVDATGLRAFRPGERALAVVRPEAVRIRDARAPARPGTLASPGTPSAWDGSSTHPAGDETPRHEAPARLEGTVEAAEYFGTVVRYVVRMDDAELLVDLPDPRAAVLPRGRRVWVELPEVLHLLPAE